MLILAIFTHHSIQLLEERMILVLDSNEVKIFNVCHPANDGPLSCLLTLIPYQGTLINILISGLYDREIILDPYTL